MPTPRVERPITAAERSARARGAARARMALSPPTMTEARAAVFRKFEDAIDAIAPGLPDSERETRAVRLRASWLSFVALGAARRRRGQQTRRLNLDEWLAERLAVAQRKADASLT
jgi:hypothetical protein